MSQDAPVTKVWRKSVNRNWRYRGNVKLPRESRTDGRTHARTDARTDGRRHGRTTRKHIASAGDYRRRRLKKLRKDFDNIFLRLGHSPGHNLVTFWRRYRSRVPGIQQFLRILCIYYCNSYRHHARIKHEIFDGGLNSLSAFQLLLSPTHLAW